MDNKIFLCSTDTTIGFICKNKAALDRAKNRAANKKYIRALPNLRAISKRVPKRFKKYVRRAKKTTFIIDKDYSFRVIRNKHHNLLINRLGWAYTTSANKSGEEFDLEFAISKADIIVYPLKNGKPSTIYKLFKRKLKRIR